MKMVLKYTAIMAFALPSLDLQYFSNFLFVGWLVVVSIATLISGT